MPILNENGYKTRTNSPKPIEYEITANGCWEVTNLYRDGYGYFTVSRYNKKMKLHRYVYALNTGRQLDESIVVRHKCDNPSCVNPEHLEEGTVQDNNHDMVERNRYRTGKNHQFAAGITREQFQAVCDLLTKGESVRETAESTGVSNEVVSRIRSGKHWSLKEYGRNEV